MTISGVDLVYLAMEGADYLVPEQMNYGMKLVPQLGFQYLSATLRAGGYKCRIYDQPILGFDPPKLNALLNKNPDRCVGFYTDSFLKPKVIAWIRKLRELGCKKAVLIGGPGSFGAEDYLAAGADIVVHGEGERTIIQIMEYLNGTRKKADLKGVSYTKKGGKFDAPAQDLIRDVDSIPFPFRDDYPVRMYHDFHMFPMRVPFIGVLSSRGCPHRCTFCASPAIWGRRVRQRSPENMLAEIDMLNDRYEARFLGFKDDVFAPSRRWLEEFCEGMILRNYPITFSCNIHPFSFKKRPEESVEMLARAGCRLMVSGLQSVDPAVLKNINRAESEPDDLMRLAPLIKKNGIALVVEFIFGLPGDSYKSWEDANRWSRKAGPNYALYYSLSKLEGSAIGDQYKDKPVTMFTETEIRNACARNQRRFFTSPKNIIRNIWFVIKRNPRWFLYVARNIPYLIEGIGLKFGKKKPQIESRTM